MCRGTKPFGGRTNQSGGGTHPPARLPRPDFIGTRNDEVTGNVAPFICVLQGHHTSLVSRKWLDNQSVIPAKAGIQAPFHWIPAFAGMTKT